jgi:hypothetical protein
MISRQSIRRGRRHCEDKPHISFIKIPLTSLSSIPR